MLKPKVSRRNVVTTPSWPRVNTNANASGMPAKFDATLEKVETRFEGTPAGCPG